MKAKGFTLNQPLIFIFVLIIVAVVCIPFVINFTEKSALEKAKSSSYEYIRIIELQAINNMVNGGSKLTGTYTIKNADLYDSNNKLILDINMTGLKPEDGGTVVLFNNMVMSGTLIFKDYHFNYDGKEFIQINDNENNN